MSPLKSLKITLKPIRQRGRVPHVLWFIVKLKRHLLSHSNGLLRYSDGINLATVSTAHHTL